MRVVVQKAANANRVVRVFTLEDQNVSSSIFFRMFKNVLELKIIRFSTNFACDIWL